MLLITEVLGFLRFENPAIMRLLYLFSYFSLVLLIKYLDSLFDTVLHQYDLIFMILVVGVGSTKLEIESKTLA